MKHVTRKTPLLIALYLPISVCDGLRRVRVSTVA
jgi:hypothetical protein